MQNAKTGEAVFEAGSTIMEEDAASPFVFTILSGWAMRTRTLENGCRQVLNFMLPGDLIGLQAATIGQMLHSVEALTQVTACAIPMQNFWQLFREQEGLAQDVAAISELEKATMDELLVSSGQRSVSERICFILLYLFERAGLSGLVEDDELHLPFGQDVLADTIGISLVHTNKTLSKLRRSGLFSWTGRSFRMRNKAAMEQIVGQRPFIYAGRPFV